MYEELINSLRICGDWTSQVRLVGRDCCDGCKYQKDGVCESFKGNKELLLLDAADAIEELQKERDNWKETAEDWRDAYYHWFENYQNDVPKWIPVTERLPIHNMNVLICYDWTGKSGTVYREVGIASIEELEREPTEMFRPIAWMPLPSAEGLKVGEEQTKAKLTKKAVKDARWERAYKGTSFQELADRYGVSKKTMQNAINVVTWKCVQYFPEPPKEETE